MAITFPASPVNGQTHTENGQIFVFDSTRGYWLLKKQDQIVASTSRSTFVATAGQTVHTVNYDPSASVIVSVNGVMLNPQDITSTNGTSIIFDTALALSDEVDIVFHQPTASNLIRQDISDPMATESYVQTYVTNNSSVGVTTVADMAALIALTGMANGDQALVTANNNLFIYSGSGWYKIATVQNDSPSAITGVSGTYELAIDGTATVITAVSTDPEGFPLTWSYSASGIGSIATVSQSDNVFTITPSTTEADAGTFTLTINATDGANGAVSTSTNLTLEFIVIVANSKYTTLLATATGTSDNNNITDASSNNHSITVNGDAHAGTFSPFRSGGYSTYFDGTTDYIEHQGTFTLPAGTNANWTIECWVNLDQVNLNQGILRVSSTAASGNNNDIYFSEQSGYLVAACKAGGINSGTSNYAMTANVWHHIAMVKYNGIVYLYNNGVYCGSVSDSNDYSGSYYIYGGLYYSTSYCFAGYLADFKISNTAIYTSGTSNFSVPTERLSSDSSTLFLTCHLPYIADGSSNNHAITLNGDVSTKPFAPYDYEEYSATDHGGSVYFDGTGDALRIADNSNIQLGTSSFTIEGWFYCNNTTPTQGILAKRDGSSEYWRWIIVGGNLNFRFLSTGDGSLVFNTVSVPTKTWCHFAVTRDSNNDVRQFVNGISTQNAINFTGNFDISGSFLRVGEYELNTGHFSGFVSDIKIIKNSALYTADFTPPSAPLSSSGASLHIKGTDASIIDKSQVNNLKLIGGAAGSTTLAKFSNTKSIDFGDGSLSSVMEVPSGAGYTGLFTIEFWMYNTYVTSTWQSLISNSYVSGSEYFRFYKQLNNGQFALYHNSTSARLSSIGNIANNTWAHVAIVRDSSNDITVYQDGSSIGSYNNSDVFGTASNPINVGKGGVGDTTNYPMSGYIQDLRITNGLARYTANFTPPTAPLEG